MKFKVGDRVKVREDLKPNEYYGGVRFDSDMRKMKGRTVTIISTFDDDGYRVEGSIFYWTDEMFENKKYTYEDLKKAPIGTKVTFENNAVLIKLHNNYYRECKEIGYYRNEKDLRNLKDNLSGTLGKIIKIEEPTYQTVYEYKPEILDEAEKRYLRGVIRPFRDKVEYIQKCKSIMYEDSDYINIYIEGSHSITLPYFGSNTMYKNMKDNKKYTLKELGI